ncbi:MAG TPA: cytochrome c [Anaeromyxobacteraceae bacterium]|nr:cytochrome c [Anaeromyxobacteraceae bacterium]
MRPAPLLAVLLLAPPLAALGSAPAPDPGRGEQVMQSFCLSCHGRAGKNPLEPRLNPEVWGDPDRAYLNIGRLSQIQPRMDQPFTRSDEDRRALAAYLARLARQNRVPAWKLAAPYAAMGLAVALAGAFFLWSRRRASS